MNDEITLPFSRRDLEAALEELAREKQERLPIDEDYPLLEGIATDALSKEDEQILCDRLQKNRSDRRAFKFVLESGFFEGTPFENSELQRTLERSLVIPEESLTSRPDVISASTPRANSLTTSRRRVNRWKVAIVAAGLFICATIMGTHALRTSTSKSSLQGPVGSALSPKPESNFVMLTPHGLPTTKSSVPSELEQARAELDAILANVKINLSESTTNLLARGSNLAGVIQPKGSRSKGSSNAGVQDAIELAEADIKRVDAALNKLVALETSDAARLKYANFLLDEARDFAKAREIALAMVEETADKYIAIGTAEFLAGDASAALEDFKRAEQLEPNNEKALVNEAICLVKLGRADDAYMLYCSIEENTSDEELRSKIQLFLKYM